MEDTGLPLVTDLVARPAQQRAVVVLRHRRVSDHTGGATSQNVLALYVQALRRAVERPLEVDVTGVGVHLARDVGPLLLGDSVHPRLVGLARRGV